MAGNFDLSYTFKLLDKGFTSSIKKINKGLGKTESSLSKVAKKSRFADKEMKGLGQTLKKAGGYFAAYFGGKAVINTIAEFGASMSKVKGLTNATGKEMFALREQAKGLGVATKFSASQAANAQAILAQKGKTVNEILKMMPGLLNLASAGNIGLEEATSIAVGTMNAFKVEASKTSEVVDQLAYISNSTGAGMDNLGRAFVNIAPDAESFGFTIAETAVMLGVLADSNVLNERAGTGVKIMFQRLVRPVGEVKKGLRALGLTTEDVTPALHDSETILRTLKTALEKEKDPLRRAKIEMAIYGAEASKVGKILVGNTEAIEKQNKKVLEQNGLANKLARTYEDNLKGDILQLKSAMQGLTLDTGEGGLTGALRGSTQAATEFFRQLGKEREIGDVTSSMEGLLTVVESIGWALGKITIGAKAALGAFAEANEFSNASKEERKLSSQQRKKGESNFESLQRLRFKQKLEERTIAVKSRKEAERLGFEGSININGAPAGSTAEFNTPNPFANLGVNMSFAGEGI